MLEVKQKHVLHLAQIRPEPIGWLWPGHIAAGKLTLIDGDPGLGKSMITLDLSARLTTGRDFPDYSPCPGPGGVVLVGSEDGVSDTIISRLQAAGADLNHVHSFDGISRAGASNGPPAFPDDCPLLEEVIQESKARLVIIDPLLAFISGNVWSVNDQKVRGALAPLARVAEKNANGHGVGSASHEVGRRAAGDLPGQRVDWDYRVSANGLPGRSRPGPTGRARAGVHQEQSGSAAGVPGLPHRRRRRRPTTD
jgi:hypothetical protein